jgi:putative ABC transport system substrate-binding protein
MRLIGLAVILALAFTLGPLAAEGQQAAGTVPRVGVMSPQRSIEPPTTQREPFERGLRELGWTPGSNIVIHYRYAEGAPNGLPEIASELVRLKVDVIVARGALAIQAARDATRTIPIVMSTAGDPVREGFVASLARPGGNVTGLANLNYGDIEAKRLELLKQMIPKLARVAVLSNAAAAPDPDGSIMRAFAAAARSMSLELEMFEISHPAAITEMFAAIGRARIGAVMIRADPLVLEPNIDQIVALALRHRLISIYPWRIYVNSGGLMSYATSIPGFHYRSATYVDKILRGTKPADLPVEQPTKFELVINLKTAKALGLTIPQTLLLRADQVIQ